MARVTKCEGLEKLQTRIHVIREACTQNLHPVRTALTRPLCGLWEVLSSEEAYVATLREMLDLFLLPTKDSRPRNPIPTYMAPDTGVSALQEMVVRSAFGWGGPRQREDFLLFASAVEEMANVHEAPMCCTLTPCLAWGLFWIMHVGYSP